MTDLIVVGLGPADAKLVTTETADLLTGAATVVLRTRRHPAADLVPDAPSFDDVYESAESFREVYQTIVDRLVDLASEADEPVVYAVPGSPSVAEHTVELLLADDRVQVDVRPALSFADLAWTRLGIDPLAEGVRIVDGRNFTVDAAGERGPLLVAQCDQPHVLSDIKLAVDDPGDLEVVVIQQLGLPDEQIFTVGWNDLDREVEPDHLTSVFIPKMAAPVAPAFARLAEMMHRLRQECPWDSAQTHESLRRHLLEETYEVLEAIDAMSSTDEPDEEPAVELLAEELGDLLFQVFIHAELAAEAGHFTVADVATGIYDKLYVRHPHVYGDTGQPESVDDLLVNWEQQKVAEKSRESMMDGIPAEMPALLFASKIQKKAEASGDPVEVDDASKADLTTEVGVGRALMALVDTARANEIDPEQALRIAARAAEATFRTREAANRS